MARLREEASMRGTLAPNQKPKSCVLPGFAFRLGFIRPTDRLLAGILAGIRSLTLSGVMKRLAEAALRVPGGYILSPPPEPVLIRCALQGR